MGRRRARGAGRGDAESMSMRSFVLVGVGSLAFALAGFASLTFANRGTEVSRPSFYLEALLRGWDIRLDASANEPLEEGFLRWWYAPPDRWRWEIYRGPDGSEDELVFAESFDGERLWLYNGERSIHCSVPFEPRGAILFAPPIPVVIGPSVSTTLSDLIEELEARTPQSTAQELGTTSILGREINLVEYAPVSPGESSSDPKSGQIGFDDERDFILWHAIVAAPAEGQSQGRAERIVEVVRLDYGDSADRPPEGADGIPEGSREVIAGSTGCDLAAGDSQAHQGRVLTR